jgi:hypothetical protein
MKVIPSSSDWLAPQSISFSGDYEIVREGDPQMDIYKEFQRLDSSVSWSVAKGGKPYEQRCGAK